jgi:hypothetical protein
MGRPEDEIGRELRANRPAPSDEQKAVIADAARASTQRPRAARWRETAVIVGLVVVAAAAAVGSLAASSSAHPTPAEDQYKCNSGRGNGSEGDPSQLVDPHAGETGPGIAPTVDCDPGNSGNVNRGGD